MLINNIFFANNIDLLTVGFIIAASGIMGFLIYFHDVASVTNRTFLKFSLATILWGGINYLAYKVGNAAWSLWLVRWTMFAAAWQAYYFFFFFSVYPRSSYAPSKLRKIGLPFLVFLVSLLMLSPFVFKRIIEFIPGQAPLVEKGPAILLFAIVSIGLVLAGLEIFIKKIFKVNKKERFPYIVILLGTVITFALIIGLNFVLPTFFNIVRFIPFGALFVFPFIVFTSYAIIRHKVFNIKVVTTGIVSFTLIIFSFLEVVLSSGEIELLFRFIIFLILLGFSIILLRSVVNEVRRREETAHLAHSLERANIRLQELDKQKTEFLSIAAHQLRTPLSIIKGYIEIITEGGYGKIGTKVVKVLENMNTSNEHLIKLVDEFLDISRIEQGRTKFVYRNGDINKIVSEAVKNLNEKAAAKNRKIIWNENAGLDGVYMDEEKIHHVVYNYIDNALKYSDKGNVKVIIEKDYENNGAIFRVKDHGVGFEKTDEANFFQKFYRGDNVKGLNVNGNGLGLYVCRKFIEAHQGRIWAHSNGLGTGSEFGFWIPLRKQ